MQTTITTATTENPKSNKFKLNFTFDGGFICVKARIHLPYALFWIILTGLLSLGVYYATN
jgi:hypothetical protein